MGTNYLFPSSPMSSLQMLIRIGHQKVQNNTVKASPIWVKRQNIFCHYHLDHVSPGHTRVYVLCFPLSVSQFCLSYGKEGSGSGGCSVATAEWGYRD